MNKIQFTSFLALASISAISGAQGAADETAALAVLASDAGLYEKAMACDELGRVGTAKAVPVLAELLADEKLHDYARDGLERIPDPAAGKALLKSLATLKGDLRVGVIISLGDRGEESAVPRLGRIAKGKNQVAASAALASLGQIASDDAGKAILAALSEGDAKRKTAAANAALLAAQRMERDGRNESAAELRKAATAAGVPIQNNKKKVAGK